MCERVLARNKAAQVTYSEVTFSNYSCVITALMVLCLTLVCSTECSFSDCNTTLKTTCVQRPPTAKDHPIRPPKVHVSL